MKFKVTASRTQLEDPPRNPFRVPITGFGRARTTVRTWEFEAKNDAAVRALWRDAQRQNIGNVRGFSLDTIEIIP